jgi:hypothetical protein
MNDVIVRFSAGIFPLTKVQLPLLQQVVRIAEVNL